MSIDKIRTDYRLKSLDAGDLTPDPLNMFRLWFDEAVNAQIPDVNAMSVATCDTNGMPDNRILLLKGIENGNFVFYTNHESSKGQQLAQNPNVALCFFWVELERQVRVNGTASKLPASTAEAYFKTRPYESQIGAWASDQSRYVSSRRELEQRFEEALLRFPDKENVPMPPYWGGYEVTPVRFEFWQGRTGRLHDRFEYVKKGEEWVLRRMFP